VTTRPLRRALSIVAWLIKDMVFVASNTLSLEQVREAQTRRDLLLGDEVVPVFGLIDDELADLLSVSTACIT